MIRRQFVLFSRGCATELSSQLKDRSGLVMRFTSSSLLSKSPKQILQVIDLSLNIVK
ncbi:hypothetical protein CDEST_11030 [Colletotrichum destructivum]|uniref:Uncharacterized protein n=1 Tax=Colletotrichum destructivum TaxID=34406 RepID=A0AAX4IRZ4_9PEZI|nr:hypothetical protein CDEST_11030 [Colletotrichum destructivum]